MNNLLGRTQLALVTNKSGGTLNQGDVVIIDTANAIAVKTTTTSAYKDSQICVVYDDTIANNAIGLVVTGGFCAKINLSASASIGDFVKTHSVAGQGVRHAAPQVAGDFAQVLQTGTSPAGILFGSVNQGSSSSVSEILDIPTAETDTSLVLAPDGAGGVQWVVPSSGGITWNQVVNENGSSFANFTSSSGTWSSDGTVIKQTDTSTPERRAKYNTTIVTAHMIYESEIQLRTSGAIHQGGLLVGYDGSNNSGLVILLDEGADQVQIVTDGVAQRFTLSSTVVVNTWYKMRLVCSGGWATIYIDGTLLGTAGYISQQSYNASFIGLWTYQAEVWYRNIKAWNLDMPA